MDLFALTRKLIDVESVTGNEGAVGELLAGELNALGYAVRMIPVEGARKNVFALPPGVTHPEITLSTHMDVVPPFFASSEDVENIYGRGACDAKGIIAAQIAAAEKLRAEDIAIGLLFVVGEERDSLGAKIANNLARELHGGRCRFLINGEPTENRVALASKGTLRVQLTANGKMAHSAYPELGDSAIEKLVHALERLLKMPLPAHPEFGRCTLNIGLIEGGRATNVIPDHARAQLLYRLIESSDELRRQIIQTVGDAARVEFTLEIPFTKLRALDGLPTMIAAFTTDIPALPDWGEPMLLGPGSIHVAHTEREYISKRELTEAVDLYCRVAKGLQS